MCYVRCYCKGKQADYGQFCQDYCNEKGAGCLGYIASMKGGCWFVPISDDLCNTREGA